MSKNALQIQLYVGFSCSSFDQFCSYLRDHQGDGLPVRFYPTAAFGCGRGRVADPEPAQYNVDLNRSCCVESVARDQPEVLLTG